MLAEPSSGLTPFTPTEDKNSSCTESNERSAEEPTVKYFRTAAAKKQYDFTPNNRPTISSLSELIVQGLNSIRKAEEMNRESQLLLANSKKLLADAVGQIQLLGYVDVYTISKFCRVFNIHDSHCIRKYFRNGKQYSQLDLKPDVLRNHHETQ